MEQHDLKQGSAEWLAHRANFFNASEASAMLGCSPYKTRDQLLREMATGISPEINPVTQSMFDAGHAAEALARPLAEALIEEDLFPVTGSEGRLSASFDGLTMDESTCWEHKILNKDIRAARNAAELPERYRVQMEQQMLISGATRALFSSTRWEGDELLEAVHHWYEQDLALRGRIVAGWEQFAKDLEAYRYEAAAPVAVAAPIMQLPALSIQVNGSISLISNLDRFGVELNAFVGNLDMSPSDDQGFVDAESAIKTLQTAQNALESAEASALAQTASIDDMRRAVALYVDIARKARLALQAMVKERKESIRVGIITEYREAFVLHVASLNKRIGKPYVNLTAPDFVGAMKGLKTITSLRNAVATLLANAKIEANALADKIEINLNSLRDMASGHAFLFSDAASLVNKSNDDLVATIKARIGDHEAAEAKRIEAERARIQQEEEAKAAAKVRAEQEAEIAKARAEEQAKAKAESDRAAAENERIWEENKRIMEEGIAAAEKQSIAEILAPAPSAPIDIRSAVVEHQDEISTFLKARNFPTGKENEYRAVLVEFVKHQATLKAAA